MIRQLIVVRAADFPFLGTPPETGDTAQRERLLFLVEKRLRELLGDFKPPFQILEVPSLNWTIRLTQEVPRDLPPLERLVISIGVPDTPEGVPDFRSLEQFREAAEDAINTGDDPAHIYGVGADLSLAESEYFCPANVDQLLFGDRSAAAALTRSAILQQQGLTGGGVNVVVIDEGFDATKVGRFGGGLVNNLTVQPGVTRRGHGLMMVRNIVDAA